MKKMIHTLLLGLAMVLGTAHSIAEDSANALVSALTSQLGVSSEQASGGAGSLFALAKDTLGKQDFASLAKSVPGMDSLLSAAPDVGGGDKMGGLFGGAGKALSGGKEVYDQFKSLGLDTTKIGEYVSVMDGYLKSEGGQSAVDLFQKGVNTLM